MADKHTFAGLRRYPRLRIQTPFPCSFMPLEFGLPLANAEEEIGVVYDISLRGLKVMSASMPCLGTQVAIGVRLPHQTSPASIDRATVRWKTSQAFGLEFTALSKFSALSIRAFIVHSILDRTEAMKGLARQIVNDEGGMIFGRQYLNPQFLDYSLESLNCLNEYLEKIRLCAGIEKAWSDVVNRVGAYIGEVIRLNDTKHAWLWIDFDTAKSLDSKPFETFGRRRGSAAVLFSGNREFALPLEQVERYLRLGSSQNLIRFAQAVLAWGCTETSTARFHQL